VLELGLENFSPIEHPCFYSKYWGLLDLESLIVHCRDRLCQFLGRLVCCGSRSQLLLCSFHSPKHIPSKTKAPSISRINISSSLCPHYFITDFSFKTNKSAIAGDWIQLRIAIHTMLRFFADWHNNIVLAAYALNFASLMVSGWGHEYGSLLFNISQFVNMQ